MIRKCKNYSESLFEQFALIGKAVSSSRRLQLLDLLSQGERTVEVLASEAGMSVANTSQHLKVLKSANLVVSDKNGLYIIYRLADQAVYDFLRNMRKLAHVQLPQVDHIKRKFASEHGAAARFDRKKLMKKVKKGAITLLDVRPYDEYKYAHLPGAVSIPLPELEKRMGEIQIGLEIVIYCRGESCDLAMQAVEVLRANDFNAVWVEDSVPEWRSSGFPVEAAAKFQGRN